jgi:hypothetical protein
MLGAMTIGMLTLAAWRTIGLLRRAEAGGADDQATPAARQAARWASVPSGA